MTIETFSALWPLVLAYALWLHRNLVRIDKELAVNTAKDEAMDNKIDQAIETLKDVQQDVKSLLSA